MVGGESLVYSVIHHKLLITTFDLFSAMECVPKATAVICLPIVYLRVCFLPECATLNGQFDCYYCRTLKITTYFKI